MFRAFLKDFGSYCNYPSAWRIITNMAAVDFLPSGIQHHLQRAALSLIVLGYRTSVLGCVAWAALFTALYNNN